MRLYNAIAIFDVYIVAESGEAARETLLRAIDPSSDGLKPSELTATECAREGAIRAGYRDERPFVANDVSDDDFAKITGKTTIEIFKTIYEKRG